MRIFCPVVEATTILVAIRVADLFHRGGIGAKPVGDNAPRAAIFLHEASHAAVSKREDAAEIQLSSCSRPQPLQPRTSSRRPRNLQTKTLGRARRGTQNARCVSMEVLVHFDLRNLHQIKDTEPHSWATVRADDATTFSELARRGFHIIDMSGGTWLMRRE
jgi:hypothetical protein